MIRILLFLVATISQLTFAQSKDTNIHASTTIGPQTRFEIVQSTLAAKWTFRVDKSCGIISQLVITKSDGTAWQPMPVIGLPKCPNDGEIRYQLFSSGLAARHTFLMNTDTGKSWQMRGYTDKNDEDLTGWFAFED